MVATLRIWGEAASPQARARAGGVRRHFRQRRQRTDREAAVRRHRDPVEAGDGLQVDHPRRLDEVLLEVVEDVDAPGHEDGARLLREELAGLGGARRPRQLEAIHGYTPLRGATPAP